MKSFVGQIVTVSDGVGRSVTVSNWGVAQSSRHRVRWGWEDGCSKVLLRQEIWLCVEGEVYKLI
jgi:hypothetical protein